MASDAVTAADYEAIVNEMMVGGLTEKRVAEIVNLLRKNLLAKVAEASIKIEHLRQDSIKLNTIGYMAAVALGKVKDGEDYHGDPIDLIQELIALVAEEVK